MTVSSCTCRPHPGRVIRDLFHQLHAIRHGTEALAYSNYPREAAASSYLAIIYSLREMPRSFSIKLHSETQVWACLEVDPLDMRKTPYWASEGKLSQ